MQNSAKMQQPQMMQSHQQHQRFFMQNTLSQNNLMAQQPLQNVQQPRGNYFLIDESIYASLPALYRIEPSNTIKVHKHHKKL